MSGTGRAIAPQDLTLLASRFDLAEIAAVGVVLLDCLGA